MFNRLKRALLNCPTKFQLKKNNELLLNENLELVNTIEQLYLKISQLEEYYSELLAVNNELLARLNEYQSFTSTSVTQAHQNNLQEDSSSKQK